jgi:hypothetical protein
MQCYYYNKAHRNYEFIEPEDMYTIVLEPWLFEDEDVEDWKGFSPTGRTTSFQIGLGPKQRVASTFNSFYSMPDYYMLCAMRFERWWRCDQVYYDDRAVKYDHAPLIGKSKKYPCYREYYEAIYACADDIFKYLIELAYNKRANNFFEADYSNKEILSFPTVYDTPKAPERITYTY